jgi:uncharacterized membrane protein (UPF0127 family)
MAGPDRRYRIVNTSRGVTLAEAGWRANTFVTRGIGLMFRRALPPGGGLIIPGSSSVVTFFMRFPIDVLFVDRAGKVAHIVHGMAPWRTSKIVRGSKLAIELPAGTAKQTGTEPGDIVEIEPV